MKLYHYEILIPHGDDPDDTECIDLGPMTAEEVDEMNEGMKFNGMFYYEDNCPNIVMVSEYK